MDLIVTDPPYEVHAEQGLNHGNLANRWNGNGDLITNDITDGYSIEKMSEYVVKLQGDKVNAYFWCNKKQIPQYFDTYVNKLGCKFDIICWHKNNALPTFSHKYLTDTEYCLYFHKNGGIDPKSYEDAKTYVELPINAKDKKEFGHPTIKPLSIIEKLIRNSSKEGDTVLDMYMGSGTTGVACKKLNRHFVGIEINPTWFEVAKQRIGIGGSQQSISPKDTIDLW